MAYLCFAGFSAALLLCVITGRSTAYALTVGLVLFLLYGRREGHTWTQLLRMCRDGIWRNRLIFLNFVFIGMLTASWRASGTIPFVVTAATGLIRPSIFLMMAFVLCSLISFLTGTAMGTAATMGVISMAMASAMDVSPVLTGGAVLSGCYFGDRMSSVSSSALLVSGLTETDIYDNIRNMARSCIVPFFISCLVYLALGLSAHHGSSVPDLRGLFSREFVLSPLCVLPAAVLLALAALKNNMRLTMGCSTLIAAVLTVVLQHMEPQELLPLLWRGYRTADPSLSAVLNGGGILSMRRIALIFTFVSAFSGDLPRDAPAGRPSIFGSPPVGEDRSLRGKLSDRPRHLRRLLQPDAERRAHPRAVRRSLPNKKRSRPCSGRLRYRYLRVLALVRRCGERALYDRSPGPVHSSCVLSLFTASLAPVQRYS